jgi:hypothetical protein
VVKEADLPSGSRNSQLFPEPFELSGVHVGAIQRKELNTTFFDRVVSPAVHVKRLVEAFVRIVVVAEGGIEFDALV